MSKIYTSSDKTLHVDRFFLSYAKEEDWLNEMASKGMYLVKKSFYRYYFVKGNNLDAKYTVELLEHPANNPLCEEYIKSKKSRGAELVAYYKCRAYFRVTNKNYGNEWEIARKTRTKSVSTMFALYLIAFITSVVMFCYHCSSSLKFTVENSKETMHSLTEKFSIFGIFEKLAKITGFDHLLGDYQSTSVALMFLLITIGLSVPTAIYFRELYLIKSKKIKAPLSFVSHKSNKDGEDNKAAF